MPENNPENSREKWHDAGVYVSNRASPTSPYLSQKNISQLDPNFNNPLAILIELIFTHYIFIWLFDLFIQFILITHIY